MNTNMDTWIWAWEHGEYENIPNRWADDEPSDEEKEEEEEEEEDEHLDF